MTIDRTGILNHWRNLLKEHNETESVQSSVIHNIIVFPEKKTIYIKYPKCGGSTLYKHIIKKRVPEITLRYNKTQFIDWLNKITQEEFENYYIFTITRNPYSRIISAYRYLYGNKKNASFDKFCTKTLQTNYNHHWIPMNIVCNNQNIFNYIGDLETNFNESVLILLEKIDWKNEQNRNLLKPQQHNQSDKKIVATYTPHTIQIVNEMYEKDFVLFKYEKKN